MTLRKREELESREAVDIQRMAREGAGSIVTVALVITTAVVVLTLSAKLNRPWDLSAGSANRLAPQTREVLRGIDRPVELYALFPRTQDVERELYWGVLKKFREEAEQLEVEFIDPLLQPGRLRDLDIDPREHDLAQGGITMVRSGPRRLTFRGMEEEDVVNAILEVGRSAPRIVGIVRGFGERDPASQSSGDFAKAVDALEREYYEVVDVDLSDGISPAISVLMFAGPTAPIPPPELDTVQEWLLGGGRMLALIDPEGDDALNRVLGEWGLRITDETVVDRVNNVGRSPQFVRIDRFSDHPVVADFGSSRPVAFAVSGRVEHFETGEGRLFHQELATTSSVSETVDSTDGNFPVMAASWLRARDSDVETRVIVAGDSDFASNAYLGSQANENLFLNAIAWLTRESQLIAIRRQTLEGQIVSLDGAEQQILGGTLFFVLPGLIGAIGVVVALRRRGR